MNREEGFARIPNKFVDYMKTMTEAEKDIYIYLRSWKNNYPDGYVEAAISTIMSNTGYTNRKTITSAILGLVEKGWVKDIIHQAGAGNREGKNKYLLNDEPEVNVDLLKKERARRKAKKEQMIEALTNSIASDSVEIDSVPSVTVLKKVIENKENTASEGVPSSTPPASLDAAGEENNLSSKIDTLKESKSIHSKKVKELSSLEKTKQILEETLRQIEKDKESGIKIDLPSSDGL
jgi:hypothetical protein